MTGTITRVADAGPEVRPLVGGVLIALAAGILLLASAAPRPWLVASVVVAQGVVVTAWLRTAHLPAGASPVVTVVAAAIAVDVVAAPRSTVDLPGVAAVVGVSVVGAMLAQLVRVDRRRVTDTLAAMLTGVMLAVFAAHLLALSRGVFGRRVLAAMLLCVAGALLAGRCYDAVDEQPRLMRSAARGWAGLLVAVCVGGALGAIAGASFEPLDARAGLLLGVVVAAAASAGDLAVVLMCRADERLSPVAALALTALLPLVVAAPPAYATSRLLLG